MPSLTVGAVYEAQFRYVWRCLRGLGVRDEALEDAVHDVFLVVHKKLPAFDSKVRLTTWLYAIALRVARRYRRRTTEEARKLTDVDQEMHLERSDAGPDLEHRVDTNLRLRLARRALDGLDDAKRELFVLACVEQLPASEIATITGAPINTVYSRIRSARQAFSAELMRLQTVRRST